MKKRSMLPFRLLLSLVGVVSLLVIGVLAWQAHRSMQQEQLLLHQVIAQDVFDNIETQLALIIRDEETRPFNHYSYYYIPEQKVLNEANPLMCSPIAELQEGQLIIGYFQIDPQNRLSFPHKVGNAGPRHHGNGKSAQSFAQESTLRAALAKTDVLGKDVVPVISKPNNDVSSFVVQNGIQSQVDVAEQGIFQSRSNRSQFARDYNIQEQKSIANEAYAYHQDNTLVPVDAGTTAIDLQPFRSVPVDGSTSILMRDVLVGADQGKRYRQGFLLDIKVLQQRVGEQLGASFPIGEDWQLRWLIGEHEATQLTVQKNNYGFYHRLDAPFTHMALFLEMPPHVAGIGAHEDAFFTVIFILAALLVLGLFLIDRMILVRQRFAERRQNFVAAVSHELKTPLTAIRMHAEMLEAKMVPDEAKQLEYYKTIHAESQRLSRLIDNVLTLSRLEQDSLQLHLEIGSIVPVVESAVAMLRPHAASLGFTLDCHLPNEDLPPVKFERDALTQVILNCIDNALKFACDAERKDIEIVLNAVEDGVELRIGDYGPGMPQGQSTQIFEAFYRAESELTRKTKGTGIGLALVRQLAAAMQVAVQARNRDHGGFEIAFRFQAA